MAIKYKVVKKGEDILDTEIEKSGDKVKFSLYQIQTDMDALLKHKVQIEAQVRLETAKMENVKAHHPHVTELSEGERQAVYVYQQSFAFCKVGMDKLAEIDSQLTEYRKDVAEIKEQTGLEFNLIERQRNG